MGDADKNQTVLAILQGELTEEEAAEEHGVPVDEIRAWKRMFLAAGKNALKVAERRVSPTQPKAAGKKSGIQLWHIAMLSLIVIAVGGAGYVGWQHLSNRRSEVAQRCDEGVTKRLAALKETMTVRLIVSPSNPKVTAFADAIDRLMTSWAEGSSGKLVYQRVAAVDAASKQEATELGLQEITFGSGDDQGQVAQLGRGFFGMVFEYGDERVVIPVLSPEQSQGVEFWIANKIRELAAEVEETHTLIGVAASEGGVSIRAAELTPPQSGRPGPSMAGVLTQALPFYKLVDAPLSTAIPDDVRVLLLTQPGHVLSEDERKIVDAFIMRGDRTLVVVASAVNLAANEPSMMASIDARGVDALLKPYGIELQRHLVVDDDSAMHIPVQRETGKMEKVVLRGMLLVQHDEDAATETQTLDNEFAGFFRLGELAYPLASTLVVHPGAQPKMSFRVVARTGARARIAPGPVIDLSLGAEAPSADGPARRALAVAGEGTLESAFGAGEASAKILVVASSQFLANPYARAGNPKSVPPQMAMLGEVGGDKQLQALASPYARTHLTATILALKNIFDWGSADNDLLACSALLLKPDDE